MLPIKSLLAFRPNKLHWIFALKTFIAGMLALYLAFELNLSYPIWAIGTVFVIANPYAGMTASKSIYRFLGTLFGAIFAVAVTPYLINTPLLFIFVLATWVGFCLYLSLIDRSPRSYVVMLAGYTAVIICFNTIYYIDTVSIFDMALGRFLEISLGVLCSAVVTATIFPIHLGPVIEMRVTKTLKDTRRVFDLIFSDEKHQENYTRLLADIARDSSDIHSMAEHLSYEKSKFKIMTKPLQELLHQVSMLVANLVAMSERIKQLDQIDLGYRPHLKQLHQYVEETLDQQTALDESQLGQLPEYFEQKFDAIITHAQAEQYVILGSLKMDIRHFIVNVQAVKLIWRRMQDGNNNLPEAITPLTTTYPSLHRDYGIAVRGGVSAFLTILIACSFWVLSGWKAGFMMAQMAAISACILTFLDNPVPALKAFIQSSIYAAVVVFVYAYGIFPHVTTFSELIIVLAPFLIFCLMLFLYPPLQGYGVPLLMGTTMGINFQNRYSMDQIAFFDFSIGTVLGPVIAICIVHMVRAMSPEMTVQRILALHYRALRETLKMPYGVGFRIHLRTMLDRIGVLNTKQIQSEHLKQEINHALIESSAAIDLTRLQELVNKVPTEHALVGSIKKLQGLLYQWFKLKELNQSSQSLSDKLDKQFKRTVQDLPTLGDDDVRHRIEISINNIYSSIWHQGQDMQIDTETFVEAK